MVKKVGTKDEVWTGAAQHTAGKLTKADLMQNAAGKVVSKRQHANGLKQAGSLRAHSRVATTSRRSVHPDHAEGFRAGAYVRDQHGKGLIGGLLGGLLGPLLGKISPVLGGIASTAGSLIPI